MTDAIETAVRLYPRTMEQQMADLLQQRETMVDYVQLRVDMSDWHGVRDAATDIEIIEGKLQLLGWKR